MKMCQTSSLEALVRCTKVHIHHEQLILIFKLNWCIEHFENFVRISPPVLLSKMFFVLHLMNHLTLIIVDLFIVITCDYVVLSINCSVVDDANFKWYLAGKKGLRKALLFYHQNVQIFEDKNTNGPPWWCSGQHAIRLLCWPKFKSC